MDISFLLLALIFIDLQESTSAEEKKLRLVNGGSPCAGRVELYHSGQWGTVYSSMWDIQDAAVVCKQLGCGSAVAAPTGAHFGAGTGPMWMYDVQCEGGEAALWECRSPELRDYRSYGYQHSQDAGVTCSGKQRIKAIEDQPCSFYIILNLDDSWILLHEEKLTTDVAKVACHMLECSEPKSKARMPKNEQREKRFFNGEIKCNASESQLSFCDLFHGKDSFITDGHSSMVTCFGSKGYRLVNGSNACSGRVEIQYNGEWGSLCSLEWDMADANVLCNQMSCGYAVNIYTEDYVENERNEIWRDYFHCNGTESHLKFCRSHSFGNPACPTGQVASVICSDLNGRLRLINGGSPCDGVVEIYYNGTWGRVQDELWNLTDANVVCRQLRCGTAVKAYNSLSNNINASVWLRSVQCQGNESRLLDCTLNISYIQKPEITVVSQYASVLCTVVEHMQLRLVGGEGGCAGRVEVYYNETWGTVCDDGWDLADANVVCQQLKCGHAISINNSAVFGKGSGQIWLDELMCSGNESVLWQCQSSKWGKHNCNHKEDAGVVCSEFKQLRLADGDHHCKGRLEVFHNGTWGTVCSNGLNSESPTISLVCHILGCGKSGRLHNTPTFKKSLTDKSVDRIKCQSYHASLWECPSSPWFDKPCSADEETHLTCSGEQKKPNGTLSQLSCVNKSLGMECTEGGHLRLVGGQHACSGTIEILNNGIWGTVCDDSWDMKDAQVVCRQLGCGSPHKVTGEPNLQDRTGPIWLDDVNCRGHELFLWDCLSSPWGQNDCQHKEDAGVICAGLPTTAAITSPLKDIRVSSDNETTSVLMVICIILGALLFLVLIILCGQVQKHRTLIKGLNLEGYPDGAFYDAIYEELDYNMLRVKQKQFQDPDLYSNNSINHLEYYTDENEEDEDKLSNNEEENNPGNMNKTEYDDVEGDFPVLEGYTYDDAESVPVIRGDLDGAPSDKIPASDSGITEDSKSMV